MGREFWICVVDMFLGRFSLVLVEDLRFLVVFVFFEVFVFCVFFVYFSFIESILGKEVFLDYLI